MNNTIRNIITIGAALIAFATAADDLKYNAYLSSGVQNNVVRYGVDEGNTAAAVNAGVALEGLPYVGTYDLGLSINAPFDNDGYNLSVLSTGFKRDIYAGFTGRIGIEYAARTGLNDDFNSNFRLAYEKFSLVKPYIGYAYDYNRELHIAEAGLPIQYTFDNVLFVKSVTVNAVAGYNYYQSDTTGVYQTVKFGGGFEIPVWGPLNVFAQGTYYRAIENANVAFHNDWVGVAGFNLKF